MGSFRDVYIGQLRKDKKTWREKEKAREKLRQDPNLSQEMSDMMDQEDRMMAVLRKRVHNDIYRNGEEE